MDPSASAHQPLNARLDTLLRMENVSKHKPHLVLTESSMVQLVFQSQKEIVPTDTHGMETSVHPPFKLHAHQDTLTMDQLVLPKAKCSARTEELGTEQPVLWSQMDNVPEDHHGTEPHASLESMQPAPAAILGTALTVFPLSPVFAPMVMSSKETLVLWRQTLPVQETHIGMDQLVSAKKSEHVSMGQPGTELHVSQSLPLSVQTVTINKATHVSEKQ